MSDGFVKLIPENSPNCLGLKAQAHQKPQSRIASRRNPWLTRSSMSPRLDIKRSAYLAIYKTYQAVQAQPQNQDEEHLKTVLTELSNGAENPLECLPPAVKAQLIQTYPSVRELDKNLTAEDRRQFAEFHNTLEDAQRNRGILWGSGDRNKQLANILTCFTYLYGTKPQDNPLMHNYAGSTHETAQDLLLRELRANNPGIDIDVSINRRQAVEHYMQRISSAIQGLIKMTPQELEQTFPDDNVKHLAIVRKLKTEFNRLAVQVNYPYRFKNIPNQLNDKSENYLLIRLKPMAEYYNTLESKFSWRTKKKVLLALAIVFALIVSAGQAATAIFAFTSIMAMVGIGASSFVTNFLLFYRDIKAMLINVFSGRLFNGMSKKLKAAAIFFLSLSLVTAIASGGFAYVALMGVAGIVVLSTAPWWMVLVASIIAVVTVVGITALLFMAAVSFVKALRGKTFFGLCMDALKGFKEFFYVPQFNQSLVNLIKEKRELTNQALNPGENRAARATKISAMTTKIRVEQMSHYLRHILKLVFTILLVPFAIIAAVVATVAFSIVSAKSTTDTLKVFFTSMNDIVSNIVGKVLAVCSGIVNGVLNIKNLVNAGRFIAEKASKFASGAVTIIALLIMLARHGLLLKAIMGSYQAVRDNPLKIIVPGIRTAISAVLCVLVALNGIGNGEAIRAGGTVFDSLLPTFLPKWITANPGTFATISGTSSSIAINLMACNATTLTETPIQQLDQHAQPVVVEDQYDEELVPTLFVRKSNKKGCGLFGHTPRINVSISVGPKKDKKRDDAHSDDVPLLSDGHNSVVDELVPIQSTAGIKLEVYEEFIEQQSTLLSV